MYMLDTNIIIFSLRHAGYDCAMKLADHAGIDVCISAITYAELVLRIENSSRPVQNRNAIRLFLSGIRIYDFDMEAAEEFGILLAELKKSGLYQPAHDRDRMIAAHARARGDILVTDNIRDFSDIRDLHVENWRTPGDLTKS